LGLIAGILELEDGFKLLRSDADLTKDQTLDSDRQPVETSWLINGWFGQRNVLPMSPNRCYLCVRSVQEWRPTKYRTRLLGFIVLSPAPRPLVAG